VLNAGSAAQRDRTSWTQGESLFDGPATQQVIAREKQANDALVNVDFKTSIAVWPGLYPTVVFLTPLTAPLGMPLWLGMLVGNLLSSFAMSYFTMPSYGNPIRKWWLKPSPDASRPSTNIRGLLLVLAINAPWALLFYLVAVKFWSLP
jgi:antibiotic biosynthesis monooxygenase (ABM) superfamily enzyme